MAYVLKNAAGAITANSLKNLGVGWIFVENNDHDYLLFLEQVLDENLQFRESDIQLARVLEDLISLLIERDTICFTDLPAIVQKRLIERQLRRKQTYSVSMVDSSELI